MRHPRYVLVTDAPPLQQGGHGCHVLAWNWLEAMRDQVALVVTHRLSPALEINQIRAGLGVPSLFYPDLCRLGTSTWRGLKATLELRLFRLWLARHISQIKDSGAQSVFAFFGGDGRFLWPAEAVARATGLPLDVYLVDDLEESARLVGHTGLAKKYRLKEAEVLKSAARVFTISPGFCEHLRAKYGILSHWLPLPARETELEYSRFTPGTPDIRAIAYLGAFNPLYAGALRELMEVIGQWNGSGNAFRLRLEVMTYSDPEAVRRDLGDPPALDIFHRLSDAAVQERLRQSWAIFLPTSFDPAVRLMASTSFPSKLSESCRAGRPLLVYGPRQASLPRYFLEQDLAYCVTDRRDLYAGLEVLAREDKPETIRRYRAVLERLHSAAALRSILGSQQLEWTC